MLSLCISVVWKLGVSILVGWSMAKWRWVYPTFDFYCYYTYFSKFSSKGWTFL